MPFCTLGDWGGGACSHCFVFFSLDVAAILCYTTHHGSHFVSCHASYGSHFVTDIHSASSRFTNVPSYPKSLAAPAAQNGQETSFCSWVKVLVSIKGSGLKVAHTFKESSVILSTVYEQQWHKSFMVILPWELGSAQDVTNLLSTSFILGPLVSKELLTILTLNMYKSTQPNPKDANLLFTSVGF